ncbi:DUF4247 domain-containing protein [Paenibacillus sp. CC-CFT747]|nr:DUF4247 domain-containing protein [Paenibacillus sp. CC-CFT747]
MKRWPAWIACLLVLSLIFGCSNASSYVKDNYPLVDVQGKGKDSSKIYSVEGKDVPTVAKELAKEEKPDEISKESPDQMFLAYDDKLIQVQKDPVEEKNTLVEISTIEYARNHYDSSFLQGYLTASIIQSLFGGGWFSGGGGYKDYRGYSKVPPSSSGSGGSYKSPYSSPDVKKPNTTDRSGSFNTKPTTPGSSDGSSGSSSSSGSSGSFKTGSGSSGSTSSKPSTGSSSSVRKSDGSTPSYKSSKPSTSTRSGSFSKRRR